VNIVIGKEERGKEDKEHKSKPGAGAYNPHSASQKKLPNIVFGKDEHE